jgi:hypothetical protein
LLLLFWVGSVCVFEKGCVGASRFIIECCSTYRLGTSLDLQLLPRIRVEVHHGCQVFRIKLSKFESDLEMTGFKSLVKLVSLLIYH